MSSLSVQAVTIVAIASLLGPHAVNAQQLPATPAIEFGYEANGNLTTVTDRGARSTTYVRVATTREHDGLIAIPLVSVSIRAFAIVFAWWSR
jgi:YD repeat-containing protein